MEQRCPEESAEAPQVITYHTLNAAAQDLEIKKNVMYYYIRILGIKTKRFEHNRNAFISEIDIERIRDARSPIRIVPVANVENESEKMNGSATSGE